VAVAMPSTDDLPEGPLRRLVQAIHEIYSGWPPWRPADQQRHRAALAALAERLDRPRSTDLNQTARATLDALESTELRWLLTFDNAESGAELRSMLPAGGDVIVTTRSLGWSRFASLVEVDVFDRPESIELLRRRGRGIGVDDADRLAARLGDGLPGLAGLPSRRAASDPSTNSPRAPSVIWPT
jgi:hypothetical protein